MSTGSFPGVKYGRGVLLTTHPLLVLRACKSRAITLPTIVATTGPVTETLYLLCTCFSPWNNYQVLKIHTVVHFKSMYIYKKAATEKEHRKQLQNDGWILRKLIYSFTCIWQRNAETCRRDSSNVCTA